MTNVDEDIIKELFLLVYNIGAWDQLSESTQRIGTELLNAEVDDVVNRYPIDLMPRLTMSEYNEIVGKAFGFTGASSDFWKIVVKISYLIYMCEKNSGMATMAKADPPSVMEFIR